MSVSRVRFKIIYLLACSVSFQGTTVERDIYKSLFTKQVVAKKHIHTYKYEEKQQNKRNIASKYATLLTQVKRNMV